MAIAGWILDKSAAAHASEPAIAQLLEEISGHFYMCQVGELEQLYSSRSAGDYDERMVAIQADFQVLSAPPDLLSRALRLQRGLAHHHGMWHRTPIPDLLIAETALYHGVGSRSRGLSLRPHRRDTPPRRSASGVRVPADLVSAVVRTDAPMRMRSKKSPSHTIKPLTLTCTVATRDDMGESTVSRSTR